MPYRRRLCSRQQLARRRLRIASGGRQAAGRWLPSPKGCLHPWLPCVRPRQLQWLFPTLPTPAKPATMAGCLASPAVPASHANLPTGPLFSATLAAPAVEPAAEFSWREPADWPLGTHDGALAPDFVRPRARPAGLCRFPAGGASYPVSAVAVEAALCGAW